MQNVVNGLFTTLDGSGASFSDLVGGRIFHQQAEQNIVLPLLVFEVATSDPQPHFGTLITTLVDVRFDIWTDIDAGTATASTGAGEIEQALFDLLQGFELTVTAHDRGLLLFTVRNVRSIEEDAIRITDDARIHATTV
jgi:hypothetical protein